MGAKQADAVVQTATEIVTENTSKAPSPVELLLVLSPLLLYGIFSLYRCADDVEMVFAPMRIASSESAIVEPATRRPAWPWRSPASA